MATRSVNGLLTSVDSLFTTQQERDEANLKKIYDIPISEIDDFPGHPYQVNDDEDMDRLVESIKERGIITPATVRKKDDGRYELISGHRRKRACELAGLESLRCDIVDLTRDEAIVLMVESNYQRSNILPSEKAFAYKMRLDAMNRQGKRENSTSVPLGQKLSRETLSEESGDSQTQIQRYRYKTQGNFLYFCIAESAFLCYNVFVKKIRVKPGKIKGFSPVLFRTRMTEEKTSSFLGVFSFLSRF